MKLSSLVLALILFIPVAAPALASATEDDKEPPVERGGSRHDFKFASATEDDKEPPVERGGSRHDFRII